MRKEELQAKNFRLRCHIGATFDYDKKEDKRDDKREDERDDKREDKMEDEREDIKADEKEDKDDYLDKTSNIEKGKSMLRDKCCIIT